MKAKKKMQRHESDRVWIQTQAGDDYVCLGSKTITLIRTTLLINQAVDLIVQTIALVVFVS